MKRFWECYVEGTGGGQHYKHWDLKEAIEETKRLARLPKVQGKAVYLFECVSICWVDPSPIPIEWIITR